MDKPIQIKPIQSDSMIVATKDMLHRFQYVISKTKIRDKFAVFVQSGSGYVGLTSYDKIPIPPKINISEGYPTIQLSISTLKMNEKIDWKNIKIYKRTIKAKNPNWKNPEELKLKTPTFGSVELVNKKDNLQIKDPNAFYTYTEKLMPKVNYLTNPTS